MNKNFAAKKIDFIFLLCTLFLVLFIVYRFLFENLLYCILMSALTLSVFYLIYFKIKHSGKKEAASAEDIALRDKIFFNMPFLSQKTIDEFIAELLKKAGYSVQISGGVIISQKHNKKYYVNAVFNKKADKNDVFKCEHNRRFLQIDGFMLFCGQAESNAAETAKLISNKDGYIIEKERLFSVMKRYNCYPPALMENKQRKKRFKEFLLNAFDRKRFKGYFFLGLIMFAFSYISPFKIYYLIFSALLFTFSAISLIKKTKKPEGFVDIF